jgi:hypothetical protein
MSNLMHLASCLGIVAFMYLLGSFLKASICPVLAAYIGDNRVIPIAMATERAIRERLALCPLWALALRVPSVSSMFQLLTGKSAGQSLNWLHLALGVSLVFAPSFALKVNWISCKYFTHWFITISTKHYWSIVPSMIDFLIEIASGTFVVIGWQVKHLRII